MIKFKVIDIKDFISLMKTLNELLYVTEFHFSSKGVNVDRGFGGFLLVNLFLSKNWFSNYTCNENLKITLKTLEICEKLKRLEENDEIEFVITRGDNSELRIISERNDEEYIIQGESDEFADLLRENEEKEIRYLRRIDFNNYYIPITIQPEILLAMINKGKKCPKLNQNRIVSFIVDSKNLNSIDLKMLCSLNREEISKHTITSHLKDFQKMKFLVNFEHLKKIKPLLEWDCRLEIYSKDDSHPLFNLKFRENSYLKLILKRKLEKEIEALLSIHHIDLSESSLPVLGYIKKDYYDKILNPKEIIITDENIAILFNYPLDNPVTIEFEKKGGFTRKDIYECIYVGYKKIYGEEDAIAGDPGVTPGLLNRIQTNGPFKIWGHYLGELYIESVEYNTKTRRITLSIGS